MSEPLATGPQFEGESAAEKDEYKVSMITQASSVSGFSPISSFWAFLRLGLQQWRNQIRALAQAV